MQALLKVLKIAIDGINNILYTTWHHSKINCAQAPSPKTYFSHHRATPTMIAGRDSHGYVLSEWCQPESCKPKDAQDGNFHLSIQWIKALRESVTIFGLQI